MWIGAIRLVVATKNAAHAGTDDLVTATVMNDDRALCRLDLDFSSVDDHERGDSRIYDFSQLVRRNDQTLELPSGVAQNPMPYPAFGLEFSNGIRGHLKLVLMVVGKDMWIKDTVELHVREMRLVATSFDTVDWREDAAWTHVATWSQDVPISLDFFEGNVAWSMALT